jgi:hypothetical protein
MNRMTPEYRARLNYTREKLLESHVDGITALRQAEPSQGVSLVYLELVLCLDYVGLGYGNIDYRRRDRTTSTLSLGAHLRRSNAMQ